MNPYSRPERFSLLRAFYRGVVLGRRVGLMPGVLSEVRFHLERNRPGKITTLTLPGIKGAVHLRPGTSDVPTFRQIFTEQSYDLNKISRFKAVKAHYERMLEEGKTPLILDCGANIGLSSVWFANMFPKAMVVAVEPSKPNFALLKANTAGYPNILPVLGAVWNETTKLSIENPDADFWSFQVSADSKHQSSSDSVEAFTIGNLMAMAGAEEILIAKIDIEGAEAALFQSNIDWIDSTQLIIIELHDWIKEGTSANFLNSIAQRSVHLRQRGENMLVFMN
ncbi:MAG: FkbM family methyltransferase [Rhizomicrobium sp.]